MRVSSTFAIAALALASLLAGCNRDTGSAGAGGTTATPSPSPSPPAATPAPMPPASGASG